MIKLRHKESHVTRYSKALVIALTAIGIVGSTAGLASAETTAVPTDRAGCTAWITAIRGESGDMVNVTVTSNCTDALVSVSQPLWDPFCKHLTRGYARFDGVGKGLDGSMPEAYVC